MVEQEGLITKADDPDHKLKFIYSLTQKGIDLLPIMAEIGVWGMKYQPYDKTVHGHAEQIVKGRKEHQDVIKKQLAKNAFEIVFRT